MAYKVGSTTVIDNSGNIAWERLVNVDVPVKEVPMTQGANVTTYSGSGNIYSAAAHVGWKINDPTNYQDLYNVNLSNCNCYTPPPNCNCNCYC
jgi:hypothetical protein